MDAPKAEARPEIPALTGIRFVAALLVFFHHQLGTLIAQGYDQSVLRSVLDLHVGVTFFFVLSGFVITYRYFDQASFEPRWLGRYALNRFLRIYPPYLLVLLVSLLDPRVRAALLGDGFSLFANVTLTKGFFNDLKYSGVGQSWSLTVEECFYFSAPVLFFCIRRGLGWAAPLVIAMLGLAAVVQEVGFHGFFQNFPFMLLYTFPGRCLEFFCGIGLARWYASPGERRARATVPWATWLGLLGCVLGVLALTLMPSDPAIGRSVGVLAPAGLMSASGIVLNNVLLPAAIALFYAGLLVEESGVRAVLASRPLVVLGKSSYVFYLISAGVVADFVAQLTFGSIALKLAVLTALSIALHYSLDSLRAGRRQADAAVGAAG